MTLNEAIIHAEEVSEEQLMRAGKCTGDDSLCDKYSNCMKCAEEHHQLAEWLRELEMYRNMNKTEFYMVYTDKTMEFGYGGFDSVDHARASTDSGVIVHVIELKEIVEEV